MTLKLFRRRLSKMEQFTYNGWLCGNDSYPKSILKKYDGKINKEVYGFNHLAKKITSVEPNWEYIAQEYRVKQKINGISLGRKAWDHYLKIDNQNVLVEFDGSQHYTEMQNYIKDAKYTEAIQRLGYKVVRIPYYIQLDSHLINYYFGTQLRNISISHTFLQGFRVNGQEKIPEFENTVAKNFRNTLLYKSVLPTDFCSFGLARFQHEMIDLSKFGFKQVVNEIKGSLKYRAKDYGWNLEYAIPDIKWS